MIAKCKSMIEIPFTKENFIRAKPYNYIKTNDEVYWGVFSSPDKSLLYLPRDKIKFTKLFPEFTIKYDTISPKVDKKISLTGLQLRDYQTKPAKQVKDFWSKNCNDILLHAETGFGKSYIVAYFIEKLQLKTTIIVDKTLLAQQMYDEISINSDADVGILSKNSELYDVNITTYQLLIKNKDLLTKLQKSTGFLIMDEVHVAAAQSLVDITSKFPAKYRLGLSATPTRSDGLTGLIYDLFGRNIVKGNNPDSLVVHIHKVPIDDIFYSGATNYKKKLANFLKAQQEYIITLVKKFIRTGRKICIATDIQKTQEFYADRLNNIDISTGILNANTSTKTRDLLLNKFNNEELDVIIGFGVLEKGISIPRMDTVIHLSGAGTKEKITQLIGRLKREDKRKKLPIFVDLQFEGNLEKQQNIRNVTYHKLGDAVKVFNIKSFQDYINKIK